MTAGVLLADAGNIGLLISAALTTAAVVAYAVRGRPRDGIMPWWRSPFGLHLMCFMIAFAIVLDESAVFLITSGLVLAHIAPIRPDWFAWIRVASFTLLVPPVLAWRLWIILRPPGRKEE